MDFGGNQDGRFINTEDFGQEQVHKMESEYNAIREEFDIGYLVIGTLIFVGCFYIVRKVANGSEKVMGLKELGKYDGKTYNKIYIAVKDSIFDVTSSEHYREDGSYSLFAGKDISLASAKYKTDPSLLN
jgi:predicted heme/steroid binding protein